LDRIGLIAGNGLLPIEFAREAKARGLYVAAVAHEGETREELEPLVDSLVWVKVGQVGRLIGALKAEGVARAVMAGGIDKPRSLSALRPDLRAARLVTRARGMGDDALLRALADELGGQGIEIVPSTLFLGRIVAPAGAIAGPRLDAAGREDVRTGARVLGALGPLDIGQAVVVERGVVIAVEAVEGTDALIRRAGRLGRGGAILVKAAKRDQDLRFDVPAVGPGTLETMVEAGLRGLAIEAGRTIVLELDRARRLADEQRVSFVGFEGKKEGVDV
jgi:DUF1009 family protein